ncbi:MAG: NYN domain-containing protein [Candidatus Omnitrophica bacterium]|nr:NYN domain-containing protein [Candidatus Omnitrophota bacterium]MCK4423775.1 NYN domain-containing protein [Candidatus Omnitrophota bacterium]
MISESTTKRAVVFIDGQSLFYAAKEAFGYKYPNYNIKLLAEKICLEHGWSLTQVRFYTGVPDAQDNNFWHNFWNNKLTHMGQTGVVVFSRGLRYRNKTVKLPDGKTHTFLVGQEKGIDVRIALDIIHLAHENVYDVSLVFSQDQDLSEVADEVRKIATEQNRWIKIASAFPTSPTCSNTRGINKTDWIKINKQTYDSCIDAKDYRERQPQK